MDDTTRELVRLLRGYLTTAEAAAELGLSKSRIEQFIRDGRLAVAFVAGGLRWLRRADLAPLRAPRPAGRPAADRGPAPADTSSRGSHRRRGRAKG